MKRIYLLFSFFAIFGCMTSVAPTSVDGKEQIETSLPPAFELKETLIVYLGMVKREDPIGAGIYKPIFVDKRGIYYSYDGTDTMMGVLVSHDRTKAYLWRNHIPIKLSYSEISENRGIEVVSPTPSLSSEAGVAIAVAIANVLDNPGVKIIKNISGSFFDVVTWIEDEAASL